MRVMGIDCSTYTGLAQLFDIDQNTVDAKKVLIHHPDHTGYARLQLIAKAVGNTVDAWEPDVVYIESAALNAKFNTVLMIEIGTVIRRELYIRGIPWYNVSPLTLKLFTTGNGNAKKVAMREAVKNRWGFTSKSDDVIDAYALAQLGKHLTLNGPDPSIKGVVAWNGTAIKKKRKPRKAKLKN